MGAPRSTEKDIHNRRKSGKKRRRYDEEKGEVIRPIGNLNAPKCEHGAESEAGQSEENE